MQEKLVIGQIVKPQGITGSVKVVPYVDDVKRFKKLKKIYIEGKLFEVLKTSVSEDAVIMFLKGVADRNAAETLRNKFVEIDREDAVPLRDGQYFIVDVIGSEVFTDNGDYVGKVEDITPKSYGDVYTLRTEKGKTVMFPLVDGVISSIDVEVKKIIVFKKRFSEVAVYED